MLGRLGKRRHPVRGAGAVRLMKMNILMKLLKSGIVVVVVVGVVVVVCVCGGGNDSF